jgi:beta-barrel assembly-enhancing protease
MLEAKRRQAIRRQRHPKKASSAWLWVLVAVAGLALWWGSPGLGLLGGGSTDLQVRFADKAPQVGHAGAEPLAVAHDGQALRAGERLQTAEGMCTALSLSPQASARLFIYTQLQVEALAPASGQVTLRLLSGRVWIDTDAATEVKLISPAGALVVCNAACEVEAEGGRVELLTWRGQVRGPSSTLAAGHRVSLAVGRPPALKPLPFKPDVWQAWNRRVESQQIAAGGLPPLVEGKEAVASATQPKPALQTGQSKPSKPAAPGAPKPAQATPGRPASVASSQPGSVAPGQQPPTLSTASSPPSTSAAAQQGVTEEVTMGPNDPLEKQIADQGTRDVMQAVGKLSTDSALTSRVERLGQKVAVASPRASLAWHFRVLESPYVNAMTVGYGRVYVTRSLTELLDDEELACCLGHEVAHCCLRHVEREFEKVQDALGYVTKAEEARKRALAEQGGSSQGFEQAVGDFEDNLHKALAAIEAVQSPEERWDAEYQADRNGMLYAHNAGFRPIGLIDSLEKLRKAVGEGAGATAVKEASTHPPVAERLAIARKVYTSFFTTR